MTDTVEAIMDATERRIREAGYSGFSFREVAADVGVKSASIYYHFPTKSALAAAVARRYNQRVVAAADAGVATGQNVVQAWRAVFRSALDDGAKMCLCGSLGATVPDLAPDVAHEVRQFFQAGIASLVAGGLTEQRATQVLATLEGAILMASAQGDPTLFDRATEALG
ncbi:TetR/AcrR family transcriptional repressor of nem operon [Bradyrhizobium sp. CIR48]|uniref:TetR/AcrR family transcriptional regulator n=1 Tax=Bradyrhizobium sp. CIR48 TaxID=2663840 RepID=UPI0016068D74|nr:TetR/AcrR family transcriptional regulator [Bradyrhizobium sp. CIR48]MBB4426551.1 TetR/AcrR family transcriptional repressor of nem operon [Bradyrhizobium sp. CIR48]